MKKIFEWVAGFALIAFSFYFTDRVTIFVASKSDLMNEIKTVSGEYNKEAVDAIIDTNDNTIIPGKYGRVVNNEESYLSMHEFGVFNENYLVYKMIKPNKSLEDNKDKFIKSTRNIRSISLIVDNNSDVSSYLDKNNLSYDVILTSKVDLKSKAEIINGAFNKDDFKSIDKLTTQKICIKDYSNIDTCKSYKYFLISPLNTLNSTNIYKIKNSVKGGEMILISDSAKLSDVKLLLNEIKFKDLNLVYVSNLISEQ